MSEAWEERQKARRVLEAAVAEADEKPEEVVFALPVMRRAGVSNVEFRTAARYLDEQGWITEGSNDYEAFVVTPEGVARVTRESAEALRPERPEPDEDAGDDDDGTEDEEDKD